MPKPVRKRDAEDWMLEMQRVRRIASGAQIEPLHPPDWKKAVEAVSEALGLLLGVSPEGAPEAVESARRRLRTAGL